VNSKSPATGRDTLIQALHLMMDGGKSPRLLRKGVSS
jgi:hypothetical protein